jgi:hypothetical protein
MSQKLFTLGILVFFLFTIALSFSNDRNKTVKIVANGDALRGDTGPIKYGSPAPQSKEPLEGPVRYSVNTIGIIGSEVAVDARTHYDLQSNGVIHYIIQEFANPQNISAIFMTAQDPSPWNTKNVRYFYSTDYGVSWTFVNDVAGARTGFPSMGLTNDYRAVIMGHNTDGGGTQRAQIYVDVVAGVGNWTRLNPGPGFDAGDIWGVITVSSNNKALWVASVNTTVYDTVDLNVCTNLNYPGTFLGYRNIPNGTTAQNYAVACGTGIWGVAYNGMNGGAYLIQSTNDGVTWAAPITVWAWRASDSLGTLRSIDMMYEGSNPRVFVGLGHVDPVAGTFIPGEDSKEIFWAPDINGGNPITVDSAGGLAAQTVNDIFFSCCRGVIGKAANGSAIYTAYNKTTGIQNAAGNDYFDVWFRYSFDHGATWGPKIKCTNLSGATYDYRYVSISPTNDGQNVYMITQKDSIPASSVNGAADSQAKMWLLKLTSVTGISPVSGEVPATYALLQNYPNPFNPSTKINFNIPQNAFVTLKVYDVTGRMVGNLVNQNLSAGKFEYEWNANNMPSGVYFYTLKAGDPSTGSGQSFIQTKKMVLLK